MKRFRQCTKGAMAGSGTGRSQYHLAGKHTFCERRNRVS